MGVHCLFRSYCLHRHNKYIVKYCILSQFLGILFIEYDEEVPGSSASSGFLLGQVSLQCLCLANPRFLPRFSMEQAGKVAICASRSKSLEYTTEDKSE